MYSIDTMTSLNLGEQGEHLANEIRVDMSPWVDEDNTLRFYIVALRHAETNPYIAATTMEDNVLVWPVTSADTAITGAGLATFVATDGTIIKKSKRIKTTVGDVIPGTDSDTPPDPASGWVERVINTVQSLTEDAQAAKADAESAAEHAQDVTEGIDQAGAAQIQAVQAAGNEVINSIPADYSDLTNEVNDLKSALSEYIPVDVSGLEARGLYINADKLSFVTSARLIAIPASGVKGFAITCSVSSTKRIGFADSIAEDSAVYGVVEHTGTLNTTVANTGNHAYLVIQLFTNSDAEQTVSTYLEGMTVSKITAVDAIARTACEEIPKLKSALENMLSSGDVIRIIESGLIQINNDSDVSYDGHTSINASGQLIVLSYPVALSDYIPITFGNTYIIKINSVLGTNYGARYLRIHAYNADKEWIKQLAAFQFVINNETKSFHFAPDDESIKYIRFSVPVIITERLPADNRITKVTLFAENTIFTSGISDYLRYGLHSAPPSEGAFNAIKRARQLTDAKWTAKANLPRTMVNTGDSYLTSHGGSYERQFIANQQYEGMPYSYTYNTPRYIGINVPIGLFYSCLTNPDSALFVNSAYSGNSATYYGTTCSTVVGYALNIPNIDSWYYSGIKGMNYLYPLVTNGVRHSLDDMQIGDILVQSTHVAMIGDIIKNGIDITDIEILEGTRQGCTDKTVLNSELGGVARRFWMSIDEFFTWFDGFTLYRYTNIGSVKFARNPYVPLTFGEKSMPTKYFPCMPFYGNLKVFNSASNGNTINLLIHDTSYTHLLVYRNGVQYESYEVNGLSSVNVECEYGEAEYSANLVTYDSDNQIKDRSVSCYWYTMPDYDFSITDDSTNHNISVTVRKDNFKPWYVTFAQNASENNPAGFTIISDYEESTSGDDTTYTFSVKQGSNDTNTCILALQSSKYAYFKLQKTY